MRKTKKRSDLESHLHSLDPGILLTDTEPPLPLINAQTPLLIRLQMQLASLPLPAVPREQHRPIVVA